MMDVKTKPRACRQNASEKIALAGSLLKEKRVLVLTGAGVSVAAGIPGEWNSFVIDCRLSK